MGKDLKGYSHHSHHKGTERNDARVCVYGTVPGIGQEERFCLYSSQPGRKQIRSYWPEARVVSARMKCACSSEQMEGDIRQTWKLFTEGLLEM